MEDENRRAGDSWFMEILGGGVFDLLFTGILWGVGAVGFWFLSQWWSWIALLGLGIFLLVGLPVIFYPRPRPLSARNLIGKVGPPLIFGMVVALAFFFPVTARGAL